jgi:hypothetical protein
LACLLGAAAVTISVGMSAPQLTDPGASGEWLGTVAEDSGPDSRLRRQRFTRPVTYAMAGLTAFTLLALACFAWRRHAQQAELEALPVAAALASGTAVVQPATAAEPPTAEPLAPDIAEPPAAAPIPAASPRKVGSKAGTRSSKKQLAHSTFLKSVTR